MDSFALTFAQYDWKALKINLGFRLGKKRITEIIFKCRSKEIKINTSEIIQGQKHHGFHGTMVQNNQESRHKYWVICSSIRLFACLAHSFACPTLLAPLAHSAALTRLFTQSLRRSWERSSFLWNECIDFTQFQPIVQYWWLFLLCFLLFWTTVHGFHGDFSHLKVKRERIPKWNKTVCPYGVG